MSARGDICENSSKLRIKTKHSNSKPHEMCPSQNLNPSHIFSPLSGSAYLLLLLSILHKLNNWKTYIKENKYEEQHKQVVNMPFTIFDISLYRLCTNLFWQSCTISLWLIHTDKIVLYLNIIGIGCIHCLYLIVFI